MPQRQKNSWTVLSNTTMMRLQEIFLSIHTFWRKGKKVKWANFILIQQQTQWKNLKTEKNSKFLYRKRQEEDAVQFLLIGHEVAASSMQCVYSGKFSEQTTVTQGNVFGKLCHQHFCLPFMVSFSFYFFKGSAGGLFISLFMARKYGNPDFDYTKESWRWLCYNSKVRRNFNCANWVFTVLLKES